MTAKDEAKRYLCDASPEQCFWVNNGPVLKSMEELAAAMEAMGNETYSYHANSNKNDFSSWVKDVLGDTKLANDLLSSRNKDSALKKVRSRLISLKKKAE